MEVLKHGKKFRIIVCSECECEFQFGITEIQNERIGTPDSEYYAILDYIECPECGHRMYIEQRTIEI